jgi:hypothetical protein
LDGALKSFSIVVNFSPIGGCPMRHDTFRMLAMILTATLLVLPGMAVATEVVLYSSTLN